MERESFFQATYQPVFSLVLCNRTGKTFLFFVPLFFILERRAGLRHPRISREAEGRLADLENEKKNKVEDSTDKI